MLDFAAKNKAHSSEFKAAFHKKMSRESYELQNQCHFLSKIGLFATDCFRGPNVLFWSQYAFVVAERFGKLGSYSARKVDSTYSGKYATEQNRTICP